MLQRYLKLAIPKGQSIFLWGARKTGKSTYLKMSFPKAKYIDFLKSDILFHYLNAPHKLREEVEAMSNKELEQPIILDEIQKIPILLDEIHWLIENTSAYFILCGSSARKLKRGAANMLGGRAWRFNFYPLTYIEIPKFNLLHALQNGLIPAHYQKASAKRELKAYVMDYLKEEIQAEGLVRNLPAFSRFLEALAYTHGQQVVYSNIASDCGVHASTVKEYFQILIDTLIGYEVLPYRKKVGRDIITATPKFYLFDTGVVNALANRQITELKGAQAGEAFEHYMFMELMAYRELNELEYKICYWRTQKGLEVDFILGHGDVAIEIKISKNVEGQDVKGLIAFCEEHKPRFAFVVCQAPNKRKITVLEGTDIIIMPWREFLDTLWAGKIIKV